MMMFSLVEPATWSLVLLTAAVGAYARTYADPLVQNTYTVAVEICFYDPPQKLASELGVVPTREAVAKAYALGSKAGARRNAAYVECSEGLSAPGAGQRKQFGRSPRK